LAVKKEPYPWASYSCPKIGKYKPGVMVSALTESQQLVLWYGIQALAPEMAKLIKTDTEFAEIMAAFSATLVIELADFNRFIEVGQRIFEEKCNAQTVQLAGTPPAS
jgi:hypothetical protein